MLLILFAFLYFIITSFITILAINDIPVLLCDIFYFKILISILIMCSSVISSCHKNVSKRCHDIDSLLVCLCGFIFVRVILVLILYKCKKLVFGWVDTVGVLFQFLIGCVTAAILVIFLLLGNGRHGGF